MRLYQLPIPAIGSNQIFVFGSNTQGKHGKGAALWAVQNAGAIYGVSKLFQGNSYAIITKDLTQSIHPSIDRQLIISQIRDLYDTANKYYTLEFLISYSNRPNLNGYTSQEMADMFVEASKFQVTNNDKPQIPDNIVFEVSFYPLLNLQ